MITRRILTLLWASSLALASACTSLDDPDERADIPDGGGGDDGGAGDGDVPEDSAADPDAEVDAAPDGTVAPPDGTVVPPPDNAPPEVTIDFPPPGVTTLERVRARGSVSDPDGDAISAVVINGVQAELDGDAWTAEVPLAEGENDLTPEASDEHGASAAGPSVNVQRVGEQLVWPRSCVHDAQNERMLILDRKPGTATTSSISVLYALDLETDRIALLSGRGRGQGPEFSQPTELAHDAEGERAFVLDRDLLAVFEVDLATGDRSILSGTNDGVPAFSDPSSIAFDADGGRLFVLDGGANTLFAIDVETGARSVLSDAADGAAIFRDGRITYVAERDEVISAYALVVDAIDLADGARTRIALPDNNGYTPSTGDWAAIVADGANDRVLLRNFSAIAELDLTSQSRRLLADPALTDPRIGNAGGCGLALDPVTGGALFLSYADDAVIRVPLTLTAGTTTLSGALRGEGPLLGAAALAWTGDRLLMVDRWEALVASVDIETGDRTVLSDATTGTGTALDHPTSIAHDGLNGRAIVLDGTSVFGVDLANGNRTVLSSSWQGPVGSGPEIGFPRQLSPYVDDADNRIIVVSGNMLLAVDLATGNRSEFSGPGRGTGHLPSEFRDLVYDHSAQRYIVIGDDDQVLGIDAATGNRSVMSGSMAGTTGPALVDPETIAPRGGYSVLIQDDFRIVSIDLRTGERRVLQNLDYRAFDLIHYPEGEQAVLALDNDLVTVELAGRTFETLYTPPQHGFTGFVALQELASRTAYSFVPEGMAGIAVTDLVTGESELLPADAQLPTGWFTTLLLDPLADRLYGYVAGGGLVAWDLATGSVTPVSNASLGQGPALQFPAGGAIDTQRMRLLLLDASLMALVAIDVASGDRENLSGGPVGTGDAWGSPGWIQYDAEADRAIVLDSDRLVAVDLETGARTTLSGNGTGTGAAFVAPRGLALDSERGRAIVREVGAQDFVAIDLETGDRTALVSDPKPIPAGGTFLPLSTGLDYDASRRTIFAVDVGFQGALLEIDEFTGDWVAPIGRVY